MGTRRLGEVLNIREELIQQSCYVSLQVQNFPDKLLHVEKPPGSSHAFFTFPGSWSVDSWYSGDKAFGEKEINLERFHSMRSIGNYDEASEPEDREFAIAFVNKAFMERFEHVLHNSQLENEVEEALNEQKSIIFTGHSTGGAIASLATIWFLQKYSTANSGTFLCVTFGSPLIGNHIISHALRRENWSQNFIHFVMRYDIVPRILLAPRSFIQQEFEKILRLYDPKFPNEYPGTATAEVFYTNVMSNASSVTSHVASKLMGSTNLLLETVKPFIKLSPYKPFGTCVFLTGNGKLVVSKNPEVVLQILFYSCQLSNEGERASIAHKCLTEHLGYGNEFQGTSGSSNMQNAVDLDELVDLRLASDDALGDLDLSVRARLCLRAAREFEKQKQRNLQKLVEKLNEFEKEMKKLEDYREFYKHGVGYYDAFKLQGEKRDFDANVSRLLLAGIWDEIIEMLKRYDLPDEFEAIEDWIKRGTRYRRLVEPLDIANYYRHAKDEDTGFYMKAGSRPKRYKYTQRWLEHQQKVPIGSCGESCFLAEVEELLKHTHSEEAINNVRDRVFKLQRKLGKWIQNEEVSKDVFRDVFREHSTFVKFWDKIPNLQLEPTIIELMRELRSRQTQ